MSVELQLTCCSFSDHPGHFHQRKAWRNPGHAISLAPTAGHDARFKDRRVFPYKFLIKHYPLRSQQHAQRKIFHDRSPRFDPKEQANGWHRQYESIRTGQPVLCNPAKLVNVKSPDFHERYLIERLSGIGIFAEALDWATPPKVAWNSAEQKATPR